MKKRIVMATMLAVTCACMIVGCKNSNKKEESKKESTMIIEATATAESCEFLNEWDDDLLEVFGFSYLQPPARAHYPAMEKGRTYVKGEFYIDTYEEFESFFFSVYNVMWGAISDAKQVMKETNGVYVFEGDYVVNEIYRAATDDKYDISKRLEKNAWIRIAYDSNEGKTILECRLLNDAKKIEKQPAEDSKSEEKKSE